MVLSPQDIHNKEFSVKMRGYNIDQVNDFLDQIVKDYQHVLRENDDISESLRSSQSKVKYFDNLKDSLNQSILVAQEAANKIKANSKSHSKAVHQEAQESANQIIKRSKQKANQIIQNSIHKANQLIVETTDLRKSTNDFRRKIQVMLKSQLKLTESKRWDELLNNTHKAGYQKLSNDIDRLGTGHVKSTRSKISKNASVVIYPDGTYKEI